ncbi:hypothetical protein niasHS_010094 [Heterodera schachtii]|uniref:Uncharacterized protein n=1 Tax=Heterodera schachtii TaxID=97005 RepID=A0ABD2J3X7_HETSC
MLLALTSVDTRNALLCAAVPSIGAFVGSTMAIKDQELVQFLKNQNFPSFTRCGKYNYLLANTAVTIPFGYASYLVYKIGGGVSCTDSKIAMGLYGATLLSGCFLVPTLKKHDIKALTANAVVLAGLSVATSVAFYNIDKISAYWTMPFTLWAIFCAGLTVKANFCDAKGGTNSKLTTYDGPLAAEKCENKNVESCYA